MKEKIVPRIYTRGKYSYKLVGHFSSKADATQYKYQSYPSLMLTIDAPCQYGVGVKYHVYRRL